MHKNLRSFIEILHKENELVEIDAEVDPYLEIAEIHRRVIEEGGKALFFKNIKGSEFPVVTNLFGSVRRIPGGTLPLITNSASAKRRSPPSNGFFAVAIFPSFKRDASINSGTSSGSGATAARIIAGGPPIKTFIGRGCAKRSAS